MPDSYYINYITSYIVSDVVSFHISWVTGVDVSSGEPILKMYTPQPAS
jgi:hypothetical protein